MSSKQTTVVCIENLNGKSNDALDEVLIDEKIDANGNKIQSLSSSEDDTISSTSSQQEEESDDSEIELRLKTR